MWLNTMWETKTDFPPNLEAFPQSGTMLSPKEPVDPDQTENTRELLKEIRKTIAYEIKTYEGEHQEASPNVIRKGFIVPPEEPIQEHADLNLWESKKSSTMAEKLAVLKKNNEKKRPNMKTITDLSSFIHSQPTIKECGNYRLDPLTCSWERKDGIKDDPLAGLGWTPDQMAQVAPEGWQKNRPEFQVNETFQKQWANSAENHKKLGAWLDHIDERQQDQSFQAIKRIALKKVIADANQITALRERNKYSDDIKSFDIKKIVTISEKLRKKDELSKLRANSPFNQWREESSDDELNDLELTLPNQVSNNIPEKKVEISKWKDEDSDSFGAGGEPLQLILPNSTTIKTIQIENEESDDPFGDEPEPNFQKIALKTPPKELNDNPFSKWTEDDSTDELDDIELSLPQVKKNNVVEEEDWDI